MNVQSPEVLDQLQKRLRRIEGQVRGVQRMLDEDRDCRDIVQQLGAIRSAVQQAGLEVMRAYANQCLSDPNSTTTNEELLDYLLDSLGRWA